MPAIAARLLFALCICLILAGHVLANEDAPNSKDHPLFTCYPNSAIVEYERNFNAVDFAIGRTNDGNARRQRVEGDMTNIVYFHNDGSKQPSALQVIRNYQRAITSVGGTVLYERLPRDGDGGETTLRVNSGGKEVWVLVEPGIFSAPTQSYRLAIVEVAGMQQVVSANKMLDEINQHGFIALH